jgi:uncharacterized protein YlzI (FlbEa/FlbD family)
VHSVNKRSVKVTCLPDIVLGLIDGNYILHMYAHFSEVCNALITFTLKKIVRQVRNALKQGKEKKVYIKPPFNEYLLI